jgi:hypothetical protein
MKREVRVVDHERQTLQLTTCDERWYLRSVSADGTAENKQWMFVPSVTWVVGHYPKGVGFYKWLASKGWDEAEEIKASAGDRGSKVHQAIGVLVNGGTVGINDSFENPRTMHPEPLNPDEYLCLMSFCQWFEEVKPEVIASEYTVWNEHYGYAGTVDLKCRINGVVWLIDIKTSPDIWPSFELQVSAYKHADPTLPKGARLAILQVGYKRNKHKKWKFTPVADQFELFLAARKIWKKETAGTVPLQREYPLELSLNKWMETAQV